MFLRERPSAAAREADVGKREVDMSQPYELFHRNRTTSCENVEREGDAAQPYELFHGNRTTSCKIDGLPKSALTSTTGV